MNIDMGPEPVKFSNWEWAFLIFMMFIILIGLSSCAARKPVVYQTTTVTSPVDQLVKFTYWTVPSGEIIVILHDSDSYQDALKLCKGPCAVESVGETFVLEPLIKEKKP